MAKDTRLRDLEDLCKQIRYGIRSHQANLIQRILLLRIYQQGTGHPHEDVLAAIERGLERHPEFAGWDCEDSPTGKCVYQDDEAGHFDECCVYCGDPEERK